MISAILNFSDDQFKRILTITFAAGLAVSGCAQTKAFLDSPTVQTVQSAAVKACSFMPYATTITNLIAAGIPALGTATAMANAICQAISPLPKAAPGQPVPPVYLHGVKVEGNYTS